MKRNFSLLAIQLMIWCAFPTHYAEAKPPRPNIVFFYADDMGYGDLGCYGSPVAKTPRIDELAGEGTRFAQFYVSHCVCSPTRSSAITGQFPDKHRIYAPLSFFKDNEDRHMPDWLDVNAPSFPRALQQAGYRTAMIGKWHLGGGSGRTFKITDLKTPGIDTSDRTDIVVNHPDAPPVTEYGFDYARTTAGNGPTWKSGKPWPEPHDVYPYADQHWLRWSSRTIANDTIRFLRDHAQGGETAPFYINVWFKDVHTPFKPNDEMLAALSRLDGKEQVHYAMLHFMDEQIGRVLDKLDELGLSENTMVIFSSDNGAGRGRGGSNGSLRGWKHMLYEGGIRVPLIVRWPEGGVPAGRVDESSVVNICDFVPTFTTLAGASMPEGYESDGEDFSAALRGEPFLRSEPQFWFYPLATVPLAMRSGNWKFLCQLDGSRPELFDLVADPGESENQAETNPEIVAEFKNSLLDWYSRTPVARDGL